MNPPCVRFEDEHLLAVNKPAGWHTHAPAPLSGAGIYDWLRDREPRWEQLALLHRLDKETSGLMVFGKTKAANQGLARQFESRTIVKTYRFLTDRPVRFIQRTVRSAVVRSGDHYLARPVGGGLPVAVTHLRHVGTQGRFSVWEARPVTGLTHQVRVQAAAVGLPILGDPRYGGTRTGIDHPGRLCLHATSLALRHPVTGTPLAFQSNEDFRDHGPWSLRGAVIEPGLTDAFRLVHGTADGRPGAVLECFGESLLWQAEPSGHPGEPAEPDDTWVRHVAERVGAHGVYRQTLHRRLQGHPPDALCPVHAWGARAPEQWCIRENGLRFEVSFARGHAVGLFLDQRDNRRRLLRNHVARGFPVCAEGWSGKTLFNAFAYTCGFSVSAACAGARTTNVDLSRKALDWGRRNFQLNGLDPRDHEFLAGDVQEWGQRLCRRGRRFDVVVLDPPTFSRSKKRGVFRAESDYGVLVKSILPLLAPGGTLLVSTNASTVQPAELLATAQSAVAQTRRSVEQHHFAPPPPDFPWHPAGTSPMKSFWLRIA